LKGQRGRGFEALPFEDAYIPEPMSGCWLWLMSVNNHGYGTRGFSGKNALAHRVSWVLHRGPIPDGLHVLHRCDNPACVNPDHLFLGTHADNMQDMVRKGRVKSGMAKLDMDKANEIRQLRKSGMTSAAVGRRYGVSDGNVRMVWENRIWRV
jgi:hypothetical protein